jgi:GTP-dependent phosphoenolpyruvate carboxykinase
MSLKRFKGERMATQRRILRDYGDQASKVYSNRSKYFGRSLVNKRCYVKRKRRKNGKRDTEYDNFDDAV